MSGPGDDGPSRALLRGRHQLTRSISEFTPPMRLRQLRHNEHESSQQQKDKDTESERHGQGDRRHHHRHHRHHRRHESSLGGAAAFTGESPPQNDGMPPTTAGVATPHHGRASLDMTRSEFTTPLNLTPAMSRAASVLVSGKDDGIAQILGPASQGTTSGNAEEILREEKEKTSQRVTGLQKSLGDLDTLSNTTTQRLDEMYYSVLEKTSMLQNTVAAMKELAGSAQEVKESFDRDAAEVVRDAEGQLGMLGQFEGHEQRIQAMQGRIQAGRTRLETLSARVDVVKTRVEGWERADLEWQERTRKRLKTVWVGILVIVAAIVLMAIGARLATTNGKARLLIEAPDKSANGSGEGPDIALELDLWEKKKKKDREDELRFLDEL
ncbi:hypothetical protein F5X68DRAFT_200672 [Plectosphaerella plurivora]|uniref:Uncharacterized protein n=1 Tax=Plectosphaerella plurivora TaxID=936078 RepID=A0A9P9AE08_9PEZI|nr:hypothetical protein F5X68DRAFT_200672 [Plectosphaerella plurivora]